MHPPAAGMGMQWDVRVGSCGNGRSHGRLHARKGKLATYQPSLTASPRLSKNRSLPVFRQTWRCCEGHSWWFTQISLLLWGCVGDWGSIGVIALSGWFILWSVQVRYQGMHQGLHCNSHYSFFFCFLYSDSVNWGASCCSTI